MSIEIRRGADGKPRWPFIWTSWNEDYRDEQGTIPCEHIRIAIHYHFNPITPPINTYFRELRLSKNTITRLGRKMVESVPREYDPLKSPWDPWKREPLEGCPNCGGAGGRRVRLLGTDYYDFIMCPCVTGPPQADQHCPKCRGTGSRDKEVPGDLYPKLVDCDCKR
jgi:hypothetical protein